MDVHGSPWKHLITSSTLMAQYFILFLNIFLCYLLKVDTVMEDYVEVSEPGGGAEAGVRS